MNLGVTAAERCGIVCKSETIILTEIIDIMLEVNEGNPRNAGTNHSEEKKQFPSDGRYQEMPPYQIWKECFCE